MIAVFKKSFNLLLPISKRGLLSFSFNLVALARISLVHGEHTLELHPIKMIYRSG
ncbi:hypothetical protein ES288_A05G335800v1 [Gossypium darwinii]|uniref:Uncharacterized protein n=1 Tax=Gossypium darwinii TaxID=34276 RepID=A0A5D2GM62_GOSDA|nr:hypothetical protein ES288_A05G335800v1 [Gossypium darwinii]TYH19224.1 hypothetical protein ES288_A05G335800v1 [Gossypium darwinii]